MSTTHVCPRKDIVCGDIPANWCIECPKPKYLAARMITPYISQSHFDRAFPLGEISTRRVATETIIKLKR